MADISSALRSTIPISLFNRGMAGKVFEDVRLRPLQPARLRQLRQPRLPHVQGRPAHRRAGEQLRLFGPLNLKFSSLFLPAVQLHGGEFYFISQ